mgnify:CR=1
MVRCTGQNDDAETSAMPSRLPRRRSVVGDAARKALVLVISRRCETLGAPTILCLRRAGCAALP